jgi:hypothetical protein
MQKIFAKTFIIVWLVGLATPALRNNRFHMQNPEIQVSLTAPQVRTCPKNSPNLADCFRASMESLLPYLKSGDIRGGLFTERKSLTVSLYRKRKKTHYYIQQVSILS